MNTEDGRKFSFCLLRILAKNVGQNEKLKAELFSRVTPQSGAYLLRGFLEGGIIVPNEILEKGKPEARPNLSEDRINPSLKAHRLIHQILEEAQR